MDSFELEEDLYYPTSTPEYLSKWMSKINPLTLLRKLIIPGCHKANSQDIVKPIYAVPFTKCQVDTIETQLKKGIRYLDLRYGTPTLKNQKIIQKMNIDESEKMKMMIVSAHGMCRGIPVIYKPKHPFK
jgi:hypothetical protein